MVLDGAADGRPPKAKMPQAPARGAVAGVRGDFKQKVAERGQVAVDKSGTGCWSHAFLNQKPWHPLNFRNQMKRFDAEQKAFDDEKAREIAKAEFDAEQEYMKTLSYMSPAEQQRYKDRQAVQWLYMKPPGLDAALAREQTQAAAKVPDAAAAVGQISGPTAAEGGAEAANGPAAAAAAAAAAQQQQAAAEAGASERAQVLSKVREDPYAAMLAARVALQTSDRFIMTSGVGPDHAHGGYLSRDQNQQYLVDALPMEAEEVQEDEGMALLEALSPSDRARALKRLAKLQLKEQEAQQLQEARAVLMAAGYDVASLVQQEDQPAAVSKSKSKSKKSHKHSSSHHHKSSSDHHKRPLDDPLQPTDADRDSHHDRLNNHHPRQPSSDRKRVKDEPQEDLGKGALHHHSHHRHHTDDDFQHKEQQQSQEPRHHHHHHSNSARHRYQEGSRQLQDPDHNQRRLQPDSLQESGREERTRRDDRTGREEQGGRHGREDLKPRDARQNEQHQTSLHPATVERGLVSEGDQYKESRNPTTGDRRDGSEKRVEHVPADRGIKQESLVGSKGERDRR